ncbi:uncharacterized protein N7477_003232 [Penicillium maclennaniae]|uniref:uncharacterized protein n=1 Tax=Penicillium maclennaniae TaxID=1343394 RepID=UPI002540C4D6|nr:uncharacterized protein N7477_003232 [Penicillium maclennaniae]KAJ5677599.1 hypothetical protein N7477_003232 [Penicillium maclennaniae]
MFQHSRGSSGLSPARGNGWRSSNTFIISSMSMALFTDEMLFSFMVPLLPFILEDRIGVDVSETQRLTSAFLVEGAVISIASGPSLGDIADRAKSKKVVLLALLVLTLVSIVCLSITTSLAGLFVGRLFQSIVSNGLFIVSLATLAENLGTEHMGKIAGLVSTLSAAGTFAGPVIAAFLFGFGGYWTAWAGAFAFLVVDIIMRLLMIEKQSHNNENGKPDSQDETPVDTEQASLLGERQSEPAATVPEVQGWRFYALLLRQARFSAGLFCYFVFSLLIGSFQTTFAIHVRDAFGWGVFPVGLLFAALQGPGMILSPLVGWLKDRQGSRTPTTVGFLSLAPFLWVLGAAGDDRFPWATTGDRGKIIFCVCTATVGCLICLLNGVGTMEATETVDTLETRDPGVFGKGRGYSRAIALTGMSWMTGLLVGPILAGVVVEKFGFYELQLILTLASIVAGLVAALNLNPTAREKSRPCTD